jgi:hypothetical protein
MRCLLLAGREGRRDQGKKQGEKQTKTNKKPKKICIPVGEAYADVMGC